MKDVQEVSIITQLLTVEGNLGDKRYTHETEQDPNDSSLIRLKAVQGANIIDGVNFYKHYFDYILDSKIEVYSSRIVMPDNNLKLSQIFDASPYGILNKSRTGVGATTLELNSKRNSIIVVPTQALAISKVESTKDKNTGKYQYLYVGGRIGNLRFPTIKDYSKDEEIRYKKYVVVADSLPKLEAEFGEKLFEDYFFMVDEIDSYQYDSHYRPALEDVVDYYFEFPEKQRCLTSATMSFFSHPKIKEEPIIELDYKKPLKRNINLVHTNYPVKSIVSKIKKILQSNPNDKMLIAYNSISKGILRVIEHLDDELKEKCRVLCSEKSKSYVEKYYFSENTTDKLPGQINFMTSSFFVGIDITERFHLISVSDADVIYTLLSEDKYIQILGRCRHKEGVLSETIIYSTKRRNKEEEKKINIRLSQPNVVDDGKEKKRDYEWMDFRDDLLYNAKVISGFYELHQEMNRLFPQTTNKYGVDIDTLLRDTKKYLYNRQLALVRKDIYGNIVPSYFNIDSMVIQFNLLNTLYSISETLKNKLEVEGNKINFTKETIELNDEDQQLYVQIEEHQAGIQELDIQQVIDRLSKYKPEDRVSEARKLRVRNSTSVGIFLERFIELEKYVPFEELIEKLRNFANNKSSSTKYKEFYNSVIFWALDEKHPLRLKINEEFKIGERYTSKEIASKINEIYEGILRHKEFTQKGAVEKSNMFFKKVKIRERKPSNSFRYKIKSFNVNDFKEKPLMRISPKKLIDKMIK